MSVMIDEPEPHQNKPIQVSPAVYARLKHIKEEKIGEKRCLVSFSNVLNDILNVYEQIMVVAKETVRK